jgi:hypothetical protein
MKKQPLLLTSENETKLFQLNIRLQEGRTATFTYSDRTMAREHFEQLRFHGVVGGVAIREINFEEVTVGS